MMKTQSIEHLTLEPRHLIGTTCHGWRYIWSYIDTKIRRAFFNVMQQATAPSALSESSWMIECRPHPSGRAHVNSIFLPTNTCSSKTATKHLPSLFIFRRGFCSVATIHIVYIRSSSTTRVSCCYSYQFCIHSCLSQFLSLGGDVIEKPKHINGCRRCAIYITYPICEWKMLHFLSTTHCCGKSSTVWYCVIEINFQIFHRNHVNYNARHDYFLFRMSMNKALESIACYVGRWFKTIAVQKHEKIKPPTL